MNQRAHIDPCGCVSSPVDLYFAVAHGNDAALGLRATADNGVADQEFHSLTPAASMSVTGLCREI